MDSQNVKLKNMDHRDQASEYLFFQDLLLDCF